MLLFIESVRSAGLVRVIFKSLSLEEILFPPRAATLAEMGKFKNSKVLFPPTCAWMDVAAKKAKMKRGNFLMRINTK